MALISIRSAFTCLGILGTLLLWGGMMVNGTMHSMLMTAWTGRFPDDVKLKTTYTGFWPVDFFFTILVTFFYAVMVEEVSYLVILDIVAAMLVINVMTLVESRRPGVSRGLRSALQWQYLFNGGGVAVFLPVYANILLTERASRPSSNIHGTEAKTIPLTTLWSILLPVPLLIPVLVNASPFDIQQGLFIYFLTPILFVAFQAMISSLIPNESSNVAMNPVKTAYFICGIGSTMIHLGIVLYTILSSNSDCNIGAMYIPEAGTVQRGHPNILAAGGLLFSQWDILITTITMLLLSISIIQPNPKNQVAVLKVGCITVTAGPGAALAYALWTEEDRVEAGKKTIRQ